MSPIELLVTCRHICNMGKAKDITGMRYGRLVAIKIAGTAHSGHKIWECKCDCGNTFNATANAMKRGNTLSCGCLREFTTKINCIKHHMTKTPTYRSWQAMKGRCLNPNRPYFHNYGGRGITVCERWMIFDNFLKDMGERPDGTSLDRIDNEKGYSKSNCRWATRKEQTLNRRINSKINAPTKNTAPIQSAIS